jgi:hypothetical protein
MTAFDNEDAPERSTFNRDGAPFLEQGRAQNTLRHELQKMFDAIEERIDEASAHDADSIIEVSSVPNRIIARHGTVAVSFSWLTGRLGGVSDGHLLVIEWAGLAPNKRGPGALKTATNSREASYRPEANDAASWCWRAGTGGEHAPSTVDLVGEWFDGVTRTRNRELAQA